jgi:hypothetical protein
MMNVGSRGPVLPSPAVRIRRERPETIGVDPFSETLLFTFVLTFTIN